MKDVRAKLDKMDLEAKATKSAEQRATDAERKAIIKDTEFMALKKRVADLERDRERSINPRHDIICSAEIVEIVVGTCIFHTSTKTLDVVSGSRLVRNVVAAREDHKIMEYPDRDPTLFAYILGWMRDPTIASSFPPSKQVLPASLLCFGVRQTCQTWVAHCIASDTSLGSGRAHDAGSARGRGRGRDGRRGGASPAQCIHRLLVAVLDRPRP